MKTLKIIVCALFVVCGGLLFVGCGNINKDFDISKINVNEFSQYVYDGNPHAVTVSYSGKKVNVTYALANDKNNFKSIDDLGLVDVGTYNIYYKISAKGYNSFTSSGTLELTIVPRTLTVRVQDQTLMKSELNNVFSIAYSTEGIIEGDDVGLEYSFDNSYDPTTAEYGDVYDIVWSITNSNYILNAPNVKAHIKDYFQVNDSQGNVKAYYSNLQDAIDNVQAGETIVLNKDSIIAEGVTIDKSIAIDGQGKYGITANANFAKSSYEDDELSSIFTIIDSAELTLKNVIVNGGQVARGVTVLNGNLVVDGASVINGKKLDDFCSGGVYVGNGCGFEMTSGSISGNDANDLEYTKYGADLWVDSDDYSDTISIKGGQVGNVFVKSSDNFGELTLDGGKISNVYVEYEDETWGNFEYISGEVEHLYVALKNDNGDYDGVYHEMTAEKNTKYLGGKLVYTITETTFANAEFDEDAGLNLVSGLNYIFEGCTFNVPFNVKNKVGIVFNNCTFTSNTETSLYVGLADYLIVNNCTFNGNTTGGYAIDVNLYSSSCDDVIITNNVFNTTSTDTKGAIAVKTRLGGTDYSTEDWAQDQVAGFINGVVEICGNDFNENNSVIEIGTLPQGNSTAANTSTGNFNILVDENIDGVTVYNVFKVDDQTQESEMFDKKIKISIAANGSYDSTQK